jgi:hypothetical protein
MKAIICRSISGIFGWRHGSLSELLRLGDCQTQERSRSLDGNMHGNIFQDLINVTVTDWVKYSACTKA